MNRLAAQPITKQCFILKGNTVGHSTLRGLCCQYLAPLCTFFKFYMVNITLSNCVILVIISEHLPSQPLVSCYLMTWQHWGIQVFNTQSLSLVIRGGEIILEPPLTKQALGEYFPGKKCHGMKVFIANTISLSTCDIVEGHYMCVHKRTLCQPQLMLIEITCVNESLLTLWIILLVSNSWQV